MSIVQTGDLHIAIYDLSRGLLYVANARADDESGSLYAYDRYVCRRRRIETREHTSSKWLCLFLSSRTFVRLDMTKEFTEPPPTA